MGKVKLNGVDYYTVKDFAQLTNKSEQSIRFLILYGNRIRKLKMCKMFGKPLIYATELTEFPFTLPGRGATRVYHYDENGKIDAV